MSDRPGSRDAYASKNRTSVSQALRFLVNPDFYYLIPRLMSAKETMTAPGLVTEVENVSQCRGRYFVELSV